MKLKKIITGTFSICILAASSALAFSTVNPSYGAAADGLMDTMQKSTRPTLPDMTNINIDTQLYDNYYDFKLKNDGTYEISNFKYEYSTNAIPPSTTLTLPSKYKEKPVTSIGDKAFMTNNIDYFTSLIIPSSITSIGDDAFYMAKITSFTIPSSVTHIGTNAFLETPWLENMRKQNPLVIINNILIDARTASGNVVIPSTVKEITPYAFRRNTTVTSVTIPENISVIGKYTFADCTSLTKVNLPKNLTELGIGAFNQCTELTGTITIPGSVKTIPSMAFHACNNLTEIVIQNGVTKIEHNAFSCCKTVKNISLPNSLKTIDKMAFTEIYSLKSIDIPASVESIGQYCFEYGSLNSIKFYNPKCVIYDESGTIKSSATIYGYTGSTAQTYAKTYNRKFIALDGTSKLGDVNFDNHADSDDASLVLAEYARKATQKPLQFSSQQNESADVNFDGNIDSDDASLILSYYAYTAVGGTQSPEEFFSR